MPFVPFPRCPSTGFTRLCRIQSLVIAFGRLDFCSRFSFRRHRPRCGAVVKYNTRRIIHKGANDLSPTQLVESVLKQYVRETDILSGVVG
jgi:hypothetical protein